MSGGIGRHLLEPSARAALAVGPASLGGTSAVEALDQVVANLLQLGHVGHVSLGAEEGVCRLARLTRVGRIGGELRLEAGDLAAKLLAPDSFVGLDGRHAGLALLGRYVGAGGIDGPRQIPGIDTLLARAVDSLGREPLEVR